MSAAATDCMAHFVAACARHNIRLEKANENDERERVVARARQRIDARARQMLAAETRLTESHARGDKQRDGAVSSPHTDCKLNFLATLAGTVSCPVSLSVC